MPKIYTVRIVHKEFNILSRECFLTYNEAEEQGERMIVQYHKVMENDDLFYNDVQEHIVIKGGTPNMVPKKTPLKTL